MSGFASNQHPVPTNGAVSAPTAGQKRASPLPPSSIPQPATKPAAGVENNKDKEVACSLLLLLSLLLALALASTLGQCPQTRAPSTGARRSSATCHPTRTTVNHISESAALALPGATTLSMALCCRRRALRLLLHYRTCGKTHSLRWCHTLMPNYTLNKILLHIHVQQALTLDTYSIPYPSGLQSCCTPAFLQQTAQIPHA